MNRAPTRVRPAANSMQLCRDAVPSLPYIHSGLGIGINPYRLGLALGPSSGIFKYEPPAQDSLAQAVPSGRIRQYVRFAPSVSIIKAIASSRSILACTGIPASKQARRYPAVAKKSAI